MRLRFRPRMNTDDTDEDLFRETVSAGFAQKRKTILNNLRQTHGRLAEILKRNGGASIVLCKAGVKLQRRAETLTVEEWGRIVRALE